MPKHFFTVRSTVPDASKREAFDRWYSKEHLPDAVKSFGAEKAWRYWSVSDPTIHLATYQFPERAADAALNCKRRGCRAAHPATQRAVSWRYARTLCRR